MILSHLLYHAQGKNLGKNNVISNCGHGDQIWKVAKFIFIPFHNTIIPWSPMVSDIKENT
jgi:hypothetical protein